MKVIDESERGVLQTTDEVAEAGLQSTDEPKPGGLQATAELKPEGPQAITKQEPEGPKGEPGGRVGGTQPRCRCPLLFRETERQEPGQDLSCHGDEGVTSPRGHIQAPPPLRGKRSGDRASSGTGTGVLGAGGMGDGWSRCGRSLNI